MTFDRGSINSKIGFHIPAMMGFTGIWWRIVPNPQIHPLPKLAKGAGGSAEKKITKTALAWLAVGTIALLFLLFAFRRAWLSDDAYITFRTVDNFIQGYGLTWNVDERVQAYTHPLWMFLLSAVVFFTREIYFSSIFLSLAVSAAAVLLFIKISPSPWVAAFGLIPLAFSAAYVDYATSGLENPLTHLLLLLFLAIYLARPLQQVDLFLLSLAASLVMLNRLDAGLLVLPALASAWFAQRRRGLLPLLAGQFPLVAWEAFSLLYYGFPFPNTFYAKLNTGIPSLELLRQGGYAFADLAQRDPVTLVTLVGGVLAGICDRKRRGLFLSVGVLLYLGYILKIGGDFMGGRFFSAPLLLCAFLLGGAVVSKGARWKQALLVAAALVVLGLLSPLPTYRVLTLEIQREPERCPTDAHGIADERLCYYVYTGLLRGLKGGEMPDHYYRRWGLDARQAALEDPSQRVRTHINIGVFGYFAGPPVHIVDRYALSDPLLARLPALYSKNWRIGHFYRPLPRGYLETLQSGEDRFEDAKLGSYYQKLSLIIRGELFDPRRLVEIWRLNTGHYDALIDQDLYRYYEMERVKLADLAIPKPQGTPSDSPGVVKFGDNGLEIALGGVSHAASVQLTLDNNDDYAIVYRLQDAEVASQTVAGLNLSEGLTLYTLSVPPQAVSGGFDRLRVYPLRGDGFYAIGHLQLAQ